MAKNSSHSNNSKNKHGNSSKTTITTAAATNANSAGTANTTTTSTSANAKACASIVLEQEYPDVGTILNRHFVGSGCVCKCPHLREFLPHQLSLEFCKVVSSSSTSSTSSQHTWILRDPVHALHLQSQMDREEFTGLREPPLLYGEEQERLLAAGVRGFSDQFMADTQDWSNLHQRERTAEQRKQKQQQQQAAVAAAVAAAKATTAATITKQSTQPESFFQSVEQSQPTPVVPSSEVDADEQQLQRSTQTESGGQVSSLPETTTSSGTTNPENLTAIIPEMVSSNIMETEVTAEKNPDNNDQPIPLPTPSATDLIGPHSSSDDNRINDNDTKTAETDNTIANNNTTLCILIPTPEDTAMILEGQEAPVNLSGEMAIEKDNTNNAAKNTVARDVTITLDDSTLPADQNVTATTSNKISDSPADAAAAAAANTPQSPPTTTTIPATTTTMADATAATRNTPTTSSTTSPTVKVSTDSSLTGEARFWSLQSQEAHIGHLRRHFFGPRSTAGIASNPTATTTTSNANTTSMSNAASAATALIHTTSSGSGILRGNTSITVTGSTSTGTTHKSISSLGTSPSTSKKNVTGTATTGGTSGVSSTTGTKSSTTGTSKKRKADSKVVHLAHLQAWREHAAAISTLSVSQEQAWYAKQRYVQAKSELWMESFRQARMAYWEQRRSSTTLMSTWDVQTDSDVFSTRIVQSNDVDCLDSIPSRRSRFHGDDYLQCLDCGFIGRAPDSISSCPKAVAKHEKHSSHHYLETNHGFAVTCGRQANLYCFACADLIYHEAFDRERERIDLCAKLPWWAWQEHPLQRSFDAYQFTHVPNGSMSNPGGSMVWKGLIATYPALISPAFVRAARSTRWRQILFHGEIQELPLQTYRYIIDFAVFQNRLAIRERSDIPAPVGMYNLGNTCFKSAVLQCIINCPPLQNLFLYQVMHPHVACRELREHLPRKTSDSRPGKDSETCIACELDKLILRYFSNSRGVDVISAVTNRPLVHPYPLGEPLVASDMLTSAWKCGGMDHLAGYDQRDSHEFLHGFLNSLSKSDVEFRNHVSQTLKQSKCLHLPGNNSKGEEDAYKGIVKTLFEGTLRSVLICQSCGNKRSQTESFMSISLPLSREVHRATMDGKSGTMKLTVERCLRHFTMAETLTDPVHCPSCGTKTVTRKQHVISKLPRILILHLKRFHAAQNKKIEDFVSYPEYDLSMGQYLPHWCEVPCVGSKGTSTSPTTSTTASSGHRVGGDPSFVDGVPELVPDMSYDLFATVNHYGSLQSGHYISNVKVQGRWFHCNDAHVSHNTSKDVLEEDGAYLLFYQRRPRHPPSGGDGRY